MKGQMYIIAGIIIVVVLVLLKTSLNLTRIIEDKRSLEYQLEKLEFENLKNEEIYTLEISYTQEKNTSDNIISFTRFARNSFSSRAKELDGVIVCSYINNVTANENTTLNVSVLNILGDTMKSLNLTFNGSTQNFIDVSDNSVAKANFTFNTSTDVNYTLSIVYETSYENDTEEILIPVSVGKSKFVGFFDLRLKNDIGKVREKFTKTITF